MVVYGVERHDSITPSHSLSSSSLSPLPFVFRFSTAVIVIAYFSICVTPAFASGGNSGYNSSFGTAVYAGPSCRDMIPVWLNISTNCSDHPLLAEEQVEQFLSQVKTWVDMFRTMLCRYDCSDVVSKEFSIVSNCAQCFEAYERWVCVGGVKGLLTPFVKPIACVDSSVLGVGEGNYSDGSCVNLCEEVLVSCPYIQPTLPSDSPYNGEPSFFCHDEEVDKVDQHSCNTVWDYPKCMSSISLAAFNESNAANNDTVCIPKLANSGHRSRPISHRWEACLTLAVHLILLRMVL